MSKEDIEIEAALYEDACHNPSIQQHFIDGANWAKHEIVEKACKWLSEHSMVDSAIFRKAMEDES